VGDRTPGQNAGRRIENLVRGVGIEIGRGHGADAALAETPCRRGVGLRHFLQHLHEDFGRRLGATQALRQQHPIKPVLDQGRHHRLGETPRPLDLIGLARDQRRKRSRALDEAETGKFVHAFPRPFRGSDWRRRNDGSSAAADQDGGAIRAMQMPATFSSPGQSEDQKERAVQLFGRFRVDAANNPPNAVAAERD
jgi:hypothetical protein